MILNYVLNFRIKIVRNVLGIAIPLTKLQITFMLLLFGDASFSNEDNETIFRAVHKIIHQTKRFS